MYVFFEITIQIVLYVSIIYIFHLIYDNFKYNFLIKNVKYEPNKNVENTLKDTKENEYNIKALESDLQDFVTNNFVTNNFETKIDQK